MELATGKMHSYSASMTHLDACTKVLEEDETTSTQLSQSTEAFPRARRPAMIPFSKLDIQGQTRPRC